MIPPLLCDCNSLVLVFLRLGCEARLVCVSDQIAHVVGMHGVEDSVEVGSVRILVLRVVVLQILHDIRICFELGKDVIHTKLIELRHVYKLALADLKKLLVAFEHLTKEVSVGHRRRRYIVLHYKEELSL